MQDRRQEQSEAGGGAPAASVETSAATSATAAAAPPAHVSAGAVLTSWLNRRLATSPAVVLQLGTKRATALALLPDGALRVEVAGEGGPEPQLVALDEAQLEALLTRLLCGR